eukprot:4610212-Amphidinium_carterae.1
MAGGLSLVDPLRILHSRPWSSPAMNFILEDPWRKLRRKNQHDIVLQDVQSLSDGPDELTDHLHLCLQ